MGVAQASRARDPPNDSRYSPMANPVHTIGHSNRALPELLTLLGQAEIQAVRDVRRFPHSRIHPHFEGARLQEALKAAGMDYEHVPALGGRRAPLPSAASPNGLWREAGFRGFADHALGEEFQAALAQLVEEAERRRLAILCSEAVWWRCHRRIIADYLLSRGLEVIHILGPNRAEPARLTPGAEPQPGGAIHYPAVSPEQRLFK
jgi:uncharacterized protein (DUF488 family)